MTKMKKTNPYQVRKMWNDWCSRTLLVSVKRYNRFRKLFSSFFVTLHIHLLLDLEIPLLGVYQEKSKYMSSKTLIAEYS